MASQYQYDRRDELDRRLSNLSEARASLDGVSSQMSRASYNVLAAHLNNGTHEQWEIDQSNQLAGRYRSLAAAARSYGNTRDARQLDNLANVVAAFASAENEARNPVSMARERDALDRNISTDEANAEPAPVYRDRRTQGEIARDVIADAAARAAAELAYQAVLEHIRRRGPPPPDRRRW